VELRPIICVAPEEHWGSLACQEYNNIVTTLDKGTCQGQVLISDIALLVWYNRFVSQLGV